MRRLLTILIVTIVAALAVQGPAGAVTGGKPDGESHPQAGFIMAPAPEGGFYFCSGSLIAPNVVLTAAHCTFLFSAIEATEVFVSFDSVITEDSTFYTSSEWYSHPDYVDADWPFTVDVGVLILDESLDLPLAFLPDPYLLDTYIPDQGASRQQFVDVGYGQTGVLTGGGPPQPYFPLERRQSSQRYHPGGNPETVGVIHGLTDLMLMLKANPSSRHGSGCGGDSGGPIFLGDTATVVAVHTGGYRLGFDGALCGRLSSLNHRIDTPLVLDWLHQYA
jgi:hypothetical protein